MLSLQPDGLDVAAVDPPMKRAVGRVAAGIVAHPTVVMFGRVEGLGGVRHEMAHHAHHVNDVGLRIRHFLGRATGLQCLQVRPR